MNYSYEFVNQLIDQEIEFSDSLANIYHYPDNITHLLYLIIPAFILKYGTSYRTLIENCFSTVPIIIDDKQDKVYQAYYFSKPILENENYKVIKGIVLNNYHNIGLMQLLDNLVHEFNHAMNSFQNEILVNDHILIRTGLVYHYFDKRTLSFLKTSEEEILEEVINTKQTEMIIDIIRSFSNYEIQNSTVQSTLYSVYHSVDSNYRSKSYLLESTVCQQLLKNKTFLSTIEILRMEGNLEEIHHFFDSIVGNDGSLLALSKYLMQSIKLQKELIHTKWFKKNKMNKIREVNQKALTIVEIFNQNTVYK